MKLRNERAAVQVCGDLEYSRAMARSGEPSRSSKLGIGHIRGLLRLLLTYLFSSPERGILSLSETGNGAALVGYRRLEHDIPTRSKALGIEIDRLSSCTGNEA